MVRRLDRFPGVVLVSVAATMWGLDGLIRKPLSSSTTAYTIVFGEHVFLVLLTLPLLIPAMIALPRPLDPHARGLTPIAETLAAAGLWGLGTVFGRLLGRRLAFEHVTTVRFAFGLVASACALPIVGAAAYSNAHDSFWIAVLALVTGLFALGLYYYGLRRTPALLAALGELAFPVTASLVGIYVFNSSLRWTQWLGVAVTITVISLLPVRRRDLVNVPPPEPAVSTAT